MLIDFLVQGTSWGWGFLRWAWWLGIWQWGFKRYPKLLDILLLCVNFSGKLFDFVSLVGGYQLRIIQEMIIQRRYLKMKKMRKGKKRKRKRKRRRTTKKGSRKVKPWMNRKMGVLGVHIQTMMVWYLKMEWTTITLMFGMIVMLMIMTVVKVNIGDSLRKWICFWPMKC